jgi:hypothetical protein
VVGLFIIAAALLWYRRRWRRKASLRNNISGEEATGSEPTMVVKAELDARPKPGTRVDTRTVSPPQMLHQLE